MLAAADCVARFVGMTKPVGLLVSPTVPLAFRTSTRAIDQEMRLCYSLWRLMDNGCMWRLSETFDTLRPFVGCVHITAFAMDGLVSGVEGPVLVDFSLQQFVTVPEDVVVVLFEGNQQPMPGGPQ